LGNQKPNVVYLANGYPTKDSPSHGIFNQRAAEAIREYTNLTVIQYRIYRPGRKLKEQVIENGFTRIILCVPYSPLWEKKMFYINNRLFYLFSLLYARSELRTADIVHASDGNLGILSAWLKKKFKFRLLTQFIGGDLNQDLVQVYKKSWMRNWKEKSDAVSFNSIALHKRFVQLFGEHASAQVIYRGVDTAKFFPAKDKVTGLIFYFLGGLPDYSTFTHGRNTKGGLNLMKAWSKLDAEIKDDQIKLLFAGPDADITMVKEWRQTLTQPERVEIFGKIDPSAIADFHRKGNIALVPSLEEGLPNVAMEAAATGNLIIANAVGGIPEIISHKVNGILCETNDEDGLYKQMKWATENKDQVATIGNTAAEMIGLNFSSRDFGKKYAEYYKEILKR